MAVLHTRDEAAAANEGMAQALNDPWFDAEGADAHALAWVAGAALRTGATVHPAIEARVKGATPEVIERAAHAALDQLAATHNAAHTVDVARDVLRAVRWWCEARGVDVLAVPSAPALVLALLAGPAESP